MACSKSLVSAKYHLMSPLPGRPSLASSFSGLPLKESLFLGGMSSLREILLLATNSPSPARGSAHLPALQVVNAQKRQVDSDSKSDGDVLQSRKRSWDGSNALAVTEGVCIVVAAASYTTSVFRNKHAPLVASSSAGESKFLLSKVGDLSTWYVPALWAALVINAILRTLQRRSSTKSTQKVWEERSIKDFTLDQRVGQLEEEVQGVLTMAQVLSRHLEKLGVRFRVTRRTLRDPIEETVVLTQKTSEVVQALASREQVLEKELDETQRTLVAMQAQQAKQLELLVSAMSKTSKSQEASERRILKELSRRLGEATPRSKDSGSVVSTSKEKGEAPLSSRKQQVMKDIGTLWKGLKRSPEPSTSRASPSQMKASFRERAKGAAKEERKANGHATPTLETKERPNVKSTSNPDTAFTKEDFWATSSPREISSAGSQTVGEPEAAQELNSDPQSSSSSSGRLDSFFSNKKRVHIPHHEAVVHERDFSDPARDQLFSQSGEPSGSNNGFS